MMESLISDAESALKKWKTREVSLGKLWVDMFYFYLYELDVSRVVVCITQMANFRRQDTNWRARRLAIIGKKQSSRNYTRKFTDFLVVVFFLPNSKITPKSHGSVVYP